MPIEWRVEPFLPKPTIPFPSCKKNASELLMHICLSVMRQVKARGTCCPRSKKQTFQRSVHQFTLINFYLLDPSPSFHRPIPTNSTPSMRSPSNTFLPSKTTARRINFLIRPQSGIRYSFHSVTWNMASAPSAVS